MVDAAASFGQAGGSPGWVGSLPEDPVVCCLEAVTCQVLVAGSTRCSRHDDEVGVGGGGGGGIGEPSGDQRRLTTPLPERRQGRRTSEQSGSPVEVARSGRCRHPVDDRVFAAFPSDLEQLQRTPIERR
jgi:hypothetical protein